MFSFLLHKGDITVLVISPYFFAYYLRKDNKCFQKRSFDNGFKDFKARTFGK